MDRRIMIKRRCLASPYPVLMPPSAGSFVPISRQSGRLTGSFTIPTPATVVPILLFQRRLRSFQCLPLPDQRITDVLSCRPTHRRNFRLFDSAVISLTCRRVPDTFSWAQFLRFRFLSVSIFPITYVFSINRNHSDSPPPHNYSITL